MKKTHFLNFLLLLWATLFFCHGAFAAEPTRTFTFPLYSKVALIAKKLEKAQKKDLVIFDIDGVLLDCTDPHDRTIACRQNAHGTVYELVEPGSRAAQHYSQEERHRLFSIYLSQLQESAVCKKMTALVNSLQKRGVPTLAITNAKNSPFGIIPSLAQWRIDKLKSIGISFENSFPDLNGTQFKELSRNGFTPSIESGIAFTCSVCTKPQLFRAVAVRHYGSTEKAKECIRSINMIEDDPRNLGFMAQYCQENQIPFYGHLFDKERKLPRAPFNAKVAACQLNHLLQHEQWIPHDNAKQMVEEEEKKLKANNSVESGSCMPLIKTIFLKITRSMAD